MMDYGLSDAEERLVWGDDDEFGEFDENDWADDQIKAAKEEPEYYRSIL
tara:strand:+ start:538 stop:684 length:147 start_codon:yes stop_codon:yes gene_type:complete